MKLKIAAAKLGCKGSEERYPVSRTRFCRTRTVGFMHKLAESRHGRRRVSHILRLVGAYAEEHQHCQPSPALQKRPSRPSRFPPADSRQRRT